jgi:uncharacterized coiled-coil DUF342 family protein
MTRDETAIATLRAELAQARDDYEASERRADALRRERDEALDRAVQFAAQWVRVTAERDEAWRTCDQLRENLDELWHTRDELRDELAVVSEAASRATAQWPAAATPDGRPSLRWKPGTAICGCAAGPTATTRDAAAWRR